MSVGTLVLAGLVLAVVWLALGGGSRGRVTVARPEPDRLRLAQVRRAGPLVAAAALIGWVAGPGGTRWWVIALGATVVALTLALILRGQSDRRHRLVRRARVLEFCDALAAELHGGLPAGTALERACQEWSELTPVATASRLGGDVPGTLRHLAGRPGAEGLAAVAAAWEVASRSGAALAVVVDRVAGSLRGEADAAAEVAAALGPPRATARLLTVLPVFGLGLGLSMGADPLGFLLGTTIGLACLASGSVLALLGVWWVERLATAAEG